MYVTRYIIHMIERIRYDFRARGVVVASTIHALHVTHRYRIRSPDERERSPPRFEADYGRHGILRSSSAIISRSVQVPV